MTVGVVSLTSLGGLTTALPANAASVNFGSWTSFGDTVLYSGSGEAELSTARTGIQDDGSLDFNFSGANPGSASNLATFLGVNPGGDAFEGSAIKSTITANAGDIFTFQFDFGTNEAVQRNSNLDFAFLTVGNQVFKLADTTNAPTSVNKPFFTDTGLLSYSYTFNAPGTYTLGLGVVDAKDPLISSGLYVANGKITPIPTPSLLVPMVLMGVNAVRRKRAQA